MPQIASSKSFHNKFLLSVFGDAKEQLIIGLIQDNHLMINTHRIYKTGKANIYVQILYQSLPILARIIE